METKIIKLINSIRNSTNNASYIYKNGKCYQFALILRSQFLCDIYYSELLGHVWVKFENKFYDIDGICFNIPKDIKLLDHKNGHRPHRWK